ncbi:MAG: T9SS type A sorting domain-containing protein [Aequorivita sp.]|nr:T9SS type A sorting domain-containing protein [Aequorivita sp.]
MKKSLLKTTLTISFLFCVFSFYSQERIAVIQDSQVKLLDAENGDIIDPSFISLDTGTPKALIQVADEIWVAYQLADKIERYDLDGILLGTIDTGMDNIRGLSVVNGTEVWLCNSGSNNGAPGDAIIRFDLDGNNLGFFPTNPQSDSPFDIIDNGDGEAYISYSGTNNIERRDYNGAFLGNIVEQGVVNFVQQIEIEEPGVILAAVFSVISGGNQNGLYRFSETDGAILDYWSLGNLRGVAKLGNGEILWSSAAGVSRLDPSTGVSELISAGTAQYFGRLSFNCITPPTPTGDSQQTFVQGATLADIVIDPTDVTWFATEDDALNNVNPLPLNTLLVDGETYYAVNIVDGCLSDPFAVTVSVTLGVNEFSNSNFSIYPNPTDGLITLEHTGIISEITVSNLLGQDILNFSPQASKVEVDLSSFAKGIYLVTVSSNRYSKTIRIIRK